MYKDEPLLTESQVAKQLGLAVKTLQQWRCARKGPPYVKLGHLVRYVPDDVQLFIKSKKILRGQGRGRSRAI